MWPSINFHYNLWRPRLAPNPLVLSVTGGNFPFLTARKKPADVGSPDHCQPRFYQFHTRNSAIWVFFSFFLFPPSWQKKVSNVFPTSAPLLPSQFWFLIARAWPFKGLQSPQGTGTASLAWWGRGVRGGAHGISESVSKWEQRWSPLSTLQPGCRTAFLTGRATGFLFRIQNALCWETSEASV